MLTSKWRSVRDSNPWPRPWQGRILSQTRPTDHCCIFSSSVCESQEFLYVNLKMPYVFNMPNTTCNQMKLFWLLKTPYITKVTLLTRKIIRAGRAPNCASVIVPTTINPWLSQDRADSRSISIRNIWHPDWNHSLHISRLVVRHHCNVEDEPYNWSN